MSVAPSLAPLSGTELSAATAYFIPTAQQAHVFFHCFNFCSFLWILSLSPSFSLFLKIKYSETHSVPVFSCILISSYYWFDLHEKYLNEKIFRKCHEPTFLLSVQYKCMLWLVIIRIENLLVILEFRSLKFSCLNSGYLRPLIFFF